MGHEETWVANWTWRAVKPLKEEVRRNLRIPACDIGQVVLCFTKSKEKGTSSMGKRYHKFSFETKKVF